MAGSKVMTVTGRVGALSSDGALAARPTLDVGRWPAPRLAIGAVLAAIAALALATLPALISTDFRAVPVGEGLPSHPVTSTPLSLAPRVSASVGASEGRFWVVRHGDSLLTHGGGIRATFSASGAAMRVGRGTLGLSLAGVGRGRRLDPIAAVAPAGAANQILYRHGWISEFYRNGPFGLEQGFTVRRRPGAGRGPLVLVLRVRGSLIPRPAGAQVLFRAPGGGVAVSYGQLSAVDATGRRLAVSMRVAGGTLQLRVGDRAARYPLRIDPFIKQGAKLTGSGEAGSGEFGSGVALSADGNTALVGGPGENAGVGAAWVFTRSGSTWTQQGEKLTGAAEIGAARFGASVALSSDGNTALVGGPGENAGVGAAWAFTRSGSTWTQQGEKLTGTGESGPGAFGQSVALSSDAGTALIGGPLDAVRVGASWVFTRSGSTWTQQGAKLTGGGESGPATFGRSVALSSDGNTAMIGGPHNEYCLGAAWAFVRSGGVWSQQALLRSGFGNAANCDDGPNYEFEFGYGVALSGDGNTGLISEPVRDTLLQPGGAFSFTRAGASWLDGGALLGREGKKGGTAVAVSADGLEVLLGKGEAGGIDAALPFARSGSEWAEEGSALQAGDGVGFSAFGGSVALSSSAATALIGGPRDNANLGAAWVFVRPALPPASALTGVASSVVDVSAVLNATVNPNGSEVFSCHFEYGTTTSYGFNAPCSKLPGSGENPVAVSASAMGLAANTTYHFRILAANAGGAGAGADESFTTLPDPPTVVTGAASSITQTAATLNATVNPLGETVSDCHFEYGSSNSYGNSVPCSTPPGSGSEPVEVSAPVASLSENTTYHFRIAATNSTGTSHGSDGTFNTLSNAPEYGRCVKVTTGTGRYENNGCTKPGGGKKYEWYPGVAKTHLTVKLTSGTVAFETVKHSLVACKTETGAGEYSGPKVLRGVILTFTGCERLGAKCTSVLSAEGEIATNSLEGVLGVEHLGTTTATNKIGLELFPAGKAGAFMEFSCGITPVTLRGAVIVPVAANKMLAGAALRYSASKGKQKPERFVGEPAAILEASFGAQAFEQTGLTLAGTQTSEEAVETNSVV